MGEQTRGFLAEETTLGSLTYPETEVEPYPEPEGGAVEDIHPGFQGEDEGVTSSGAAVSVLSDYSDYSDYRDFLGVEKAAETTVSPGSVQSVVGRDLGEIQEVATGS